MPVAFVPEPEPVHGEVRKNGIPTASLRETRGEYTLVVGGNADLKAGVEKTESIEEQLARLQAEGHSLNQAVARVARERALPRNEVYAQAHRSGGR